MKSWAKTAPLPMWVLLGALAGCAEPPGAGPGASAGSGKAAPSTDVGKMQAWRDAERVAARDDGRVTVIGSGESMRPIYGENTVLVLTKIDYDQLKPGMQVGYVNERGHRVVHVLLGKDAQGWRVQGLNNEVMDRDRVTRYNLIGVVYASFATDESLK